MHKSLNQIEFMKIMLIPIKITQPQISSCGFFRIEHSSGFFPYCCLSCSMAR